MSSATRWTGAAAFVGLLGVAGYMLGLQQKPLPPAPLPMPASGEVHDGPNVLIILWDTVRADRLSLYGYELPTTPNLDAFAKNARVYERAISPGIWTPPSHGSMFTGLPPSQHGVRATYKWLDDHHETMAEVLKAHGYDTYAFSANPFVAQTTNLLQGVDLVDHSFEGKWKRQARRATVSKLIDGDASTDISPAWRPMQGQKTSGTSHAYKDAGTVIDDAFFEWVEKRPDQDRPFFAYLNYMEAHIPRVPSMAARKKVMDDTLIDVSLRTVVAQINLLSYTFGKHDFTEQELEAINRTYDAALIDLDAATGELLDGLKSRGLLDNTVVILTSDHGENLGDHHMFGHKYSIWDTLLHVPLVIHHPGMVEAGRVDTPVSNLDIFGTVFDLVGLDKPEEAPLSASLNNLPTRNDVFSEMVEATPVAIQRVDKLYGVDNQEQWLTTYRAIERNRRKLVLGSDGSTRLYDLTADPQELTPIAPMDPDEVASLTASLNHWHDSFPAYDPAARSSSDAPLDVGATEMLEQLGYMVDDKDAEPEDAPPKKGGGRMMPTLKVPAGASAPKKRKGQRRRSNPNGQ